MEKNKLLIRDYLEISSYYSILRLYTEIYRLIIYVKLSKFIKLSISDYHTITKRKCMRYLCTSQNWSLIKKHCMHVMYIISEKMGRW